MKRRFFWLVSLPALISILTAVGIADSESRTVEETAHIEHFLAGPSKVSFTSPEIGESLKWQSCEVRFHPEPPTVRVYQDGKLIFGSPGTAHFTSVAICDLGDTPEPELIILNDYGGTYPIQDVAILGGADQKVWYQAEGVPWARLDDFTGDGVPEFATADRTVGPFKGYPTLLYEVGPEGLTLSSELMKVRRLPSQDLLQEEAAGSDWPDSMMWHFNRSVEIVQNLIYCGRADLARQFFDQGFKPEIATEDVSAAREAYWNAILQNLEVSPHWPVIVQMNNGSLDDRL